MSTTLKKFLPIICISVAVATGLNYLSHQAIIKISQALHGSVPAELIAELFFNIALHTLLLSMAPIALSAKGKHILGYIALSITLPLYFTLMTGVNAIAPAIIAITIGILAFYGYKKARELYHYFRAE
jgi:hypothetical protein